MLKARSVFIAVRLYSHSTISVLLLDLGQFNGKEAGSKRSYEGGLEHLFGIDGVEYSHSLVSI